MLLTATFTLGLCASGAVASSGVHQQFIRDTPGCGKTHDDIDVTATRSVESGGVRRKYSVHLPPGYSPGDAHPVILGFHGSSSIGFFFEADTRFNDAADKTKEEIIMVYPDGLGGAWAGASYSEATVPQDLQFVHDLLEDLRNEYCIDNYRIFATGMSIGGGFVDTIACNGTVGGEFAGFAPVAGAFYTDNDDNYKDCKPSKPVYMLSFNGEKDESVPYDGGEGSGGELPAISEWLERWSNRLDCEKPKVTQDAFDNKNYTWSVWNCQKNGGLAHLDMKGRNHSWPSDEPNFSQPIANDDPASFNAASVILDFFLRPDWRDPDWTPGSAADGTDTTSSGTAESTSATETGTATSSSAETSPESTTGSTPEPTPDSELRLAVNYGLACLMLALQFFIHS